MHLAHPQVSAGVFSNEDAARDSIRNAMRERTLWQGGRLWRLPGDFAAEDQFMAEVVSEWPSSETIGLSGITKVLIERHDRAGWLGAEEAVDA